MWETFERSRRRDSELQNGFDPLERWVTDEIAKLCRKLGARPFYPSYRASLRTVLSLGIARRVSIFLTDRNSYSPNLWLVARLSRCFSL